MENADAVRFTLLGGGTPVDEDELYRLYSYPAELTRCVLRGNMPYSPVTQPWPLTRLCGGTISNTNAVHTTRL
jgi:hypothetical protein